MTQTIKTHESKFIHIKKSTLNLIWKIPLGFIIWIPSFLNLYFAIIKNWEFLKLDLLFNEPHVFNYCNLLIIPELILEYFLIVGSIVFIVWLIKGKIKKYSEKGLIFGLIAGLIIGLIAGLINGFDEEK